VRRSIRASRENQTNMILENKIKTIKDLTLFSEIKSAFFNSQIRIKIFN
jgi:hypothetical protein